MHRFRGLVLEGAPEALDAAIASMSSRSAAGWSHDAGAARDLEGELSRTGARRYTAFRFDGSLKLPSARVWLYRFEPTVAKLANIVPTESGRLSMEQYNELAAKFYDDIVSPSIDGSGPVTVELESDSFDPLMALSSVARDRLLSFSRTANRNGLHGLDHDAWLQFVIASHRERSSLQPSVLGRWLSEDQSWPPEMVDELVAEYESERNLLKLYDRELTVA